MKIDNHWDARPQSGIQEADAVYELPVESGLTRFIALFHQSDSAYLGPMRSRLFSATAFSVSNKVLDLAPPILVAWLIDSVTGSPPGWMSGLGLIGMFPQIVFLAGHFVIQGRDS